MSGEMGKLRMETLRHGCKIKNCLFPLSLVKHNERKIERDEKKGGGSSKFWELMFPKARKLKNRRHLRRSS